MEPLVSFVVTYYDEPETYLRACLESIIALPLQKGEAEILVVDDGSERPFQSLLEEGIVSESATEATFATVRQPHYGIAVTRNTGLDHARGRYIQFVDADDCLIPSAYIKVLEQVRKETEDVVVFNMTRKAWEQRRLRETDFSCREIRRTQYSGQSFLQSRNLRSAVWGFAFKRHLMDGLRFSPGILHEDEEFTPQLFLRADTMLELKLKAYYYRQHEGSITHTFTPEQTYKRLNDIHFVLKELHALRNPVLQRRISQLTVDYLQNVLMLTASPGEFLGRASELRQEGLLPLPVRCYSPRYLLFSLVM